MASNLAKFKGTADVRRRITVLAKRFPRALGAALYQEALLIFNASQRIVPVDTGRLRSSGSVPPPEFRGTAIFQEVGYGTRYAFPVHENNRNVTFHGEGQDEYLRKPFELALPGMLRRVAKRTIQNEKRGIGLSPLPELKSEAKVGPSRHKKKKRGGRGGRR